ncbi:MAG: type III-B CRISPR module RAMP protein Cmr6 [Microcystis sp.]|jgi:CRISPR-associated protein Cmr6|uniref:type III-B CRISPR module RAMP protein Cmr6 n=2 Tax=Microcystis TaxID=1125 RepID=UPI0022BD60F4|nr:MULTISPECIES: type III-B CRISPR module RAMP protein Cmr6 [unclassified Microcystis]MCE2668298.1 type III-B CRISPR module RAMP protein Cmr6 [Microcystis sp. 49638_E5]MCZ8055750.1 type III-B CRISPR module RAMP protein Cmr6 [Microcystis sp. LE19-12.2C]MDJ0550159.1 type III-B CRISPR module RAMP protein Cmr6 [Microcystis sp. M49637_WE12]MDJ0585823.1 type III-B CRISPR module RAMP protein Cmr6 [Microcystis sp. M49636_WE2]
MSHSPLQRPNPPQKPTLKNPAIQQQNNHQPPKKPPSGGGGNNNPPQPSPWLNAENEPQPDQSASFVEYLRWMRAADYPHKDATKTQILQTAQENANYTQRLEQLNQRTQLLAKDGIAFQVKSTWRIRVGGHRGPESILLPAFDALGMPYIPSSTLRGVARNQAIREIMATNNLEWKEAEKEIAPYFGDINAKEEKNKTGKVVFFDAYPLPSKNGGLEMDMANNIWSWKDDSMEYSPNPNPFLSLKEPTFLIGLRLASNCEDEKILEKVKQWLKKGLQLGIGSQVNTGYGQLILSGKNQRLESEFYRLDFELEGQLIHGYQRFTQWQWNERRNEWQMRSAPVAEVRPTAFKSMLRYWFRVLASGVLPINEVQKIEAELFGGINPKKYGYLQVNILEGKVTQKEPRTNAQGKNDPCGEQRGTLVLSLSSETPKDKQEDVKKLAKNLLWFLADMGGIGQGARRPNYSRKTREYAPWFRGSTLYIDSEEDFWAIAKDVQGFKQQFQQRLQDFYGILDKISETNINTNNLRTVDQVSQNQWIDAADSNCQIFVCAGNEQRGKPHALAILHSDTLKITGKNGQREYDGNLCGKVSGGAKPSPVWIADLGNYQIVTVFGANLNPRQEFIKQLRSNTSPQNFAQIFPL